MSRWNIEISKEMYEVLARIFQILELPTPLNITSKEMEKVLNQLKYYFNTVRQDNKSDILYNNQIKVVNDKLKAVKKIQNALVISKLGIIRYQLKIILNNKNIDVVTSETPYSALAEYVKKLYNLVVIDVSGPVEDIIDVIKEIRRLSSEHSVNTLVIALLTPDQSVLKPKLTNRGIDKFIEKKDNWYDELSKDITTVTSSFASV